MEQQSSSSQDSSVQNSSITGLTLKRYPEQANSTLQAWDSADEYLLDSLDRTAIGAGPLLIVNDSFGALACGLAQFHPYCISDSLLSQRATAKNLTLNGYQPDSVSYLDGLSVDGLEANSLLAQANKPTVVLIKVPKSLALLEHQLQQLRQVVTADTLIMAAAKTVDIHTSTLQLFEKILGPTKTSLAKKKSRLIFCQPQPPYAPSTYSATLSWPLDGTTYQIHNHASVFSRSSLDIGARLFMANLPENIVGDVVDLGCGNGVIGLLALEKNPQARMIFIDESYMALASSRLNIELNRPQDMPRCEFRIDDCLGNTPASSLQAVLCNPPFHQQNSITDHIARQMFGDAKRCLAHGGELRIVGNRHLNYYQMLKNLFGNCETIASNSKFVVLKVVKVR